MPLWQRNGGREDRIGIEAALEHPEPGGVAATSPSRLVALTVMQVPDPTIGTGEAMRDVLQGWSARGEGGQMAIEAVRSLSPRAAHAVDTKAPGALELALPAKVFGSESGVRVISDLMRVVGIDSYDRARPLGGLLADPLAASGD